MAKWDLGSPAKSEDSHREQWEYARFLFNWKQDFMDIGNGKRVHWAEAWDMFGKMGEDGWEMITVTPISTPLLGHGSGDTNHLLFILKRRKAASKSN